MENLSRLLPLVIFALMGCTSPPEAEKAATNVLFLIVDDLRPQFGAYGASDMVTPNLNLLAQEGVVFERAYCNIPVCGSSRASFLSGLRPTRERFPGAYDTYLSKDAPEAISLPHYLRQNGYITQSIGKVFHHRGDDPLAWDRVWHPKARNGTGWRDYQTPENIALHQSEKSRGLPFESAAVPDSAYFDGRIALDAIKQLQILSERDEPFFLAVGFLKPHLPFNAPTKYWDLYAREDMTLPGNYVRPVTTPKRAFHNFGELRNYNSVPKQGPVTEDMAKQLIHGYYASVSYMDAQMGLVLAELERLGLADNTIVMLIGDHGWNLGDHQLWCKHCNFESSLHVPLLVKAPGMDSPKRIPNIVEFVDIYPSLIDMLGMPIPSTLEGASFVPLMQGRKREKDFAISKYWSGMTLIKDQWFYTEWLDDSLQVVDRMLFDHRVDSLELKNLALESEYIPLADSLHQFLRANWGEDFAQ